MPSPDAGVPASPAHHPLDRPTASGQARVDHTDAERECAYRLHPTELGRLETAVAEAQQRGWLVADMKLDWTHVFAFE
jgi:hypothetical protein